MQKMKMKLMVLESALVLSLLGLYACNKDDEGSGSRISYGSEIAVGNGKAQSFITTDEAGNPTVIGFRMTEKALENLPHDHNHTGTSFILDLPSTKSKTLYDHISLDWAAHGHGPEGVYDKPHFDIHFYMISNLERKDIRMDNRMEILPDTSFVPKHYFGAPGEGVAEMGKHWVDLTSPELSGKPFKTTFVYGTYNGKVIFHEPMMSMEWLALKPDTTMTLSQPKAVQKTGFYPGKYSVKYDQSKKEYLITLDDLKLKNQ